MHENKYTYAFPRPMVAADTVLLTIRDGRLQVLLVERKHDPFAGCWALPGGFVEPDEPLATAAARELHEETGVKGVRLEQLHTFGKPGRDPRGHTISVVYWSLADWGQMSVAAADDAADAEWFATSALPELAFDHADILEYAVDALQTTACTRGVGPQVLPDVFAWDALRAVYEAVFDTAEDAQRALDQVVALGVATPLEEGVETGAKARTYRFAQGKPGPF